MPAPNASIDCDLSKISTSKPIFFNAYPAVRPDTPAPITAIFLNTRLP